MLIATLPAVHQERLLERIIAHPLVDEVRYNTGISSAYSPRETLTKIIALAEKYQKKIWLDLKGRQLRITQWAAPNYGKIILNHELSVDCPARVFFRGDESSEIKVVRGNTIYVDPPPPNAIGAGQSINIHGKNLKISGYLTDEDCLYLEAAASLGIDRFMLSFVESSEDIREFAANYRGNISDIELALKIESLPGLNFMRNNPLTAKQHLMAARDDLFINIGENSAAILPALQEMIKLDPGAILASRIFAGLENSNRVALADWSDLMLMFQLGYRRFLLSDRICQRHFDAAIVAWQQFQTRNEP